MVLMPQKICSLVLYFPEQPLGLEFACAPTGRWSFRTGSPTASLPMNHVYQILGKDPDVDWLDDSIKQLHIFTDNPFHYYGDGTYFDSQGDHTPPLEKWSAQPDGLYRYYEPHTVSAFTRGCEWNTTSLQCGGQYRSDWGRELRKPRSSNRLSVRRQPFLKFPKRF